MSGAEHHAVVDRGLKMKIKRKNVNATKNDGKHEIVKGAEKMSTNEYNSANGTQMDKVKQNTSGDKSPKVKGIHKKEKIKERVQKGSDVSSVSTTLDAAFSQVSLDSKPAADSSKTDDPYDFDAKEDEGIGFPLKKVKVEKVCTVCPVCCSKDYVLIISSLLLPNDKYLSKYRKTDNSDLTDINQNSLDICIIWDKYSVIFID